LGETVEIFWLVSGLVAGYLICYAVMTLGVKQEDFIDFSDDDK